MATFKIHEDCEKENPLTMRKEKTLGINIPLQPTGLSHSSGISGDMISKDKRSNFAVLNNLSNGNQRSSKVAFRENGKNKIKDENVYFTAKSVGSSVVATTNAASKSTVVPVVEQFKMFTVYEDQNDNATQKQQQHAVDKIKSSSIYVDKENVYTQQQQQQTLTTKYDMKSEPIYKEFPVTENDYVLDSTPMSVSEILSPMSVDRTVLKQIDSSCTESTDNSQKKEFSRNFGVPLNDRQRFFEVLEYQKHILDYFRESEKRHRPKPNYMRRQGDINSSMRTILVDWLVEVSEEYSLDTETLYLCVNYLDRFLSHMSVVRSKLQLVGTAAMFIAAKYEEIYPPDVGEFVFITDDTYSKAQVLRMEQIILKILSFDLCTPSAYAFINTYAVLDGIPEKVKYLAQYISELSLLDADPFLRYFPSIISASAVALARYLLDYPIWSTTLEAITKYNLDELKEVLLSLTKSHNQASKLTQQAIQDKYKSDKYKQVSKVSTKQISDTDFDNIVGKYYGLNEM